MAHMHNAAERPPQKERRSMSKTAIDGLNEASKKLTLRIERVTSEGLTAAQESAEALVKAYETQYQTGLDLLKKSTDALKGIAEGEIADKARDLVDAAFDTARTSADTWLEFAQTSLGQVRKVVSAAI